MDKPLKDTLCYAAPFAAWLALQSFLPATAGAYAVRTVVTAAVALACAWAARSTFPAGRISAAHLRAALGGAILGLVVCALWIFPERWAWYRTWLCWPLGTRPATPTPSPYDPAVCGWALTLTKLVGSAFVIAPAEELFFRAFLYRRLQQRDFTRVPAARFDASAFCWMVFLFTLEHDRPVVAALAGAAYGLAYLRGGLLCASVAHIVTNLALALHVICRGAWAFW